MSEPAQTSNSPHREHVLVLNLAKKSAITIKNDHNALEPKEDHWAFNIPAVPGVGEDCWDLFVVEEDGRHSSVKAISPQAPSKEGYFIGKLNLQQLGYWDRRKRREGKLAKACIMNTA